jgi:glyoxylase-like metal-dependent hydrolase (beta-lactamase superfamily II)
MAAKWGYEKGLQQLGNNSWGYIQPDGSWGWSNAGLIVDGEESLLVDTLFDLKLTEEMLRTMRDAVPAARRIDTLVNTHSNGDHTFGNQLVKGARIVTTKAVDEWVGHSGSEIELIQAVMNNPAAHGAAGAFMAKVFAPFDFSGIVIPPADETFTGSLDLKVGDKDVHLFDLGPAHTQSDTIVWVPSDKVVYTGDLLFVGGHPAIWAGPVSNWIKACDTILGWDVEVVVPGHGPVCTKTEVREFRDYLEFLIAEARRRYDAGMGFEEAANDIDFGRFAHWGDAERTVANMITLWGEFSGERPQVDFTDVWSAMARYVERREADGCGCGDPGHHH